MATLFKTITKKWGNSIAIVIPQEIIDRERIKEDEEIIIEVKKRRPKVKDIFGKFHLKFNKTTQEIKDELRRDLYG